IACIYLFLRYVVAGVNLSVNRVDIAPIAGLTIFGRLLNTPAIIFYYLSTFVFPKALAIDQQWIITNANLQNFFFPLLVDLLFFSVCCVLGIYLFRVNKKKFKVFL